MGRHVVYSIHKHLYVLFCILPRLSYGNITKRQENEKQPEWRKMDALSQKHVPFLPFFVCCDDWERSTYTYIKKDTLTPPIEIVKHTATNRRRLAQLSTACSTRKPGSYSRAEWLVSKEPHPPIFRKCIPESVSTIWQLEEKWIE